uniref:Uncharacterized protein n=1 Tax=Anopheles maculatus TaxID=74869 RepID=A0A182SMF4_9DIPT
MAEQNQHNQVSNRAQHHVRNLGRTVSGGSIAGAAAAAAAGAGAAGTTTLLAESSTTPTDLPHHPQHDQQHQQHQHQQQDQHEQLRVQDQELLDQDPDELLPGAHYGPGATMLVGMMPPLLPPGSSSAPLRPTNARGTSGPSSNGNSSASNGAGSGASNGSGGPTSSGSIVLLNDSNAHSPDTATAALLSSYNGAAAHQHQMLQQPCNNALMSNSLAMAYRNQNNFMTNSHQQQCGGYLPLQTRAW